MPEWLAAPGTHNSAQDRSRNIESVAKYRLFVDFGWYGTRSRTDADATASPVRLRYNEDRNQAALASKASEIQATRTLGDCDETSCSSFRVVRSHSGHTCSCRGIRQLQVW